MRKRRAADSDEAVLDLTPMLDVVFIMLIFFIVTATFVKEAGVQVTRPEASTAAEEPSISMVVGITSDGDVWMDGREIDLNAVRITVERLRAENPRGTVIIQADVDSESGVLLEVVDQVRQAGAPYKIAAIK